MPEDDRASDIYQIKWTGKAYCHNTWESERALRLSGAKGMQKLINYIKEKGTVCHLSYCVSPSGFLGYFCGFWSVAIYIAPRDN